MDEAKLEQLEDKAILPTAVPELVAEILGERPALRIDLTDHGVEIAAVVGGVEVPGPDADSAMKALAGKVASDIRADIAAGVAVAATADDATTTGGQP